MPVARFSVGVVALLTAGLGLAFPATADPSEWPQPGSQPADAILMELERMGYAVGINWISGGDGEPLSRCKVTGYHAPGRTDGVDPASTTVYLDVICPDP